MLFSFEYYVQYITVTTYTQTYVYFSQYELIHLLVYAC